ncbi:hypothetical protein NP493_1737g00012 [Ridgeia piscesae]|uniref:Endonuclease/exonuclease/phosphatase domain-containing protein n=1 Tax=Ridgeia piscesae TaxID=27915 RepID=A0AAD9N8C7_RIDPI|nr:hypothetical protein NP493_1737g00012 [Ridgeia piscesae]
MTGYVMFRKDRLGRRGGGVILYIKESIQADEIKLEKEAECEEAIWCNIVTGNSTLTVGLVYRSPNISMEENEKIHNAIKEVSKQDCIIMGDFNHRKKWILRVVDRTRNFLTCSRRNRGLLTCIETTQKE